MAAGRGLHKLWLFTTTVLFISLILTTDPDKNTANDVSSIFIVNKLDLRECSNRNTGRKYRSCSSRVESPSWKASAGINLVKLSLGASYLVLLSGDINLNPGPVTDPCEICKKGCRRNQRAVQCDECDLWYHAKCTGIKIEEYTNIAKPTANWSCTACLFPGLDGSVSPDPAVILNSTENSSAEPNVNIRILRGLKMAHLNVNRIVNKLDSVKDLVYTYSFDILALTETWLTSDITTEEIDIPGYSIARRDRHSSEKSCGGGTLVFVRDGLPFVVKSGSTNSEFESIWLEIKRPHCKCLTLCCAYRPGDQNIDEFILNLDHSLENVDLDNSEVVLMGDFNIDYSAKKNLSRRKLDEFASKNNLSQIVCKPTRVTENSSTIIDLILVNNTHRIIQCDVLQSSISDHSPIFCVMKGGVRKLPARVSEYRSFKNFEKDAFLRDLNTVPWSTIESVEDIDDAVHLWERLFKGVSDQHAPVKSKRTKANQTPWLTEKLLEVRRDRDYHRRKAQALSSSYHWQMYRKLRNYANSEDKRLKSEYYCKLIEEASNNSSKMWKAIKETMPSKCRSEISAISVDGKLRTDPIGIVESLNQHFSSIGKKLTKVFSSTGTHNQRTISSSIFELQPVSTDFVIKQLSQLKSNKAIGLDKISARLLRDSATVIAPSLRYIINLSLTSGKFPMSWKCAKVTALFKQGDKTDMDNYRPISILPTVSKVIERTVHSQLYHYLEENKLMTINQFGFRRGRSTALALSQFTDEFLGNMDNGLVNGVVYIDLKKAFDTVDHAIMLQKLKSLGIESTHLAWFNSYLSSRSQSTGICQTLSTSRKVTVGVPQGSILGPLLFSVYVNELPSCLTNTKVTLFADDTAIYCSAKSASELQRLLNEDLRRLAQWLADHKLTLNISKSKFMLIGGSRKLNSFGHVILNINNIELDKVEHFKYLGVVIHETMSWAEHVDYVCKKAYKRIGILRRIKHLLPTATRELFVKTMILPILDYGDIVWGDKHNETLMQKIQVTQNAAAKVILEKPKYSSATDALAELSWKTMSVRRRIHRLIFIYKGLNGLLDWDFNFLFFNKVHSYNTRNKNNICKPKSNKNWGQKRLTWLCITDWNNLSEHIRILNFYQFKRAINNSVQAVNA